VWLHGGRWTRMSEGVSEAPSRRPREEVVRPSADTLRPLGAEALGFFEARGIGAATLERCGVMEDHGPEGEGVYCPAAKATEIPIAFGYWREGQLVNVKYRRMRDKAFWQVRGAEKVLYGLDDVVGEDCVVIVEGEMDKLSFAEAGVPFCVSVPDGAPAKVKGRVPAPGEDKKFEYLWNCQEWLNDKTSIVIATDADEPGRALAEELARRLGRERCYVVDWPQGGADHRIVAARQRDVETYEARLEEAR